jgi:outer membrane protein assembly factor BamE
MPAVRQTALSAQDDFDASMEIKPRKLRRLPWRSLAALSLLVLTSACSSVSAWAPQLSSPETLFGVLKPYRIEVVQGNVMTQETMAQVQPGLGRSQVLQILGAPLLMDIFHQDRWDYVFTITKQGVAPQKRRISLFFKGDTLDRIEADALPTEQEFVAAVDRAPTAIKPPVPDLTPEQMAALPVATRDSSANAFPLGAVRQYPSLEAGQP